MSAVPTPFAAVETLVGVGPMPTPTERRERLRALLAAGTLVLPGATDALGVRLIESAGFDAAYATGAGLANAQYGVPDIGLVSLGEVADHVDRLASATRLPLVVDADTGFGQPVMAMRTARRLERAGAAALQLEDQEMPKRCGHFDHHALIPAQHMQAKLVAVRQALEDPATVLIARTDARSVHDIDEAIRRGHAYVEAGADVIFVEAPRTVEELERVGRELRGVPLVVNVVEGGKTPQLTLAEYRDLGFAVVLFANFLMRATIRAGAEALAHLREAGETASYAGRIATWQERQTLFHLPEFSAAEAHFDAVGGSS
ncbi:isocitrate lyase/PEP mutase family protein [Intrasporangium calvum]|uniref:Isocitrate lyase and phosphorylmutase n=1 Tax=Intrasporangium calvum (strain ATCC 23552 / DSM 43043 / JCM 3097 / NBRC 12989 / NCIMB 10167 / NRRL B-3866 / 7 KIP) TaxID=710696 RepID=E6SCP4_INTC7|nr:oxaloacetate decarboxylase [Intrasporangium calvum]ADU49648.1 isocitrate lyase and phosphorylmutase [Intrasporangium calvum DSM 43043]